MLLARESRLPSLGESWSILTKQRSPACKDSVLDWTKVCTLRIFDPAENTPARQNTHHTGFGILGKQGAESIHAGFNTLQVEDVHVSGHTRQDFETTVYGKEHFISIAPHETIHWYRRPQSSTKRRAQML